MAINKGLHSQDYPNLHLNGTIFISWENQALLSAGVSPYGESHRIK